MDDLHIYNSLTQKKEKFEPLEENFLGIYICGPTVYGDPHLGHAKSYTSFDVVIRYFRYLGYKVRYVQNITDVGHLTDDSDQGEDKMERQARKEQKVPMEIAQKYTYKYFRDMDALGIQRPDISPRASGHIPEQIEMVRHLLEKDRAYEVNGNVYYDVSSDPGYGKLSGRDIEEQISGTRVETASDKRNPADFALWKSADDGHIMKWPSPWGMGYPGWHVECSVMSNKYLGETFDIHGGGLDNIFPHHECEIAQSEAVNDKPFARYWMHNNMVTLEGQKMGKSLGNAISLNQFFTGDHELLSRAWKPQVIRFFLLQSHYRSTSDFSEEALGAAENGLQNLHDIVQIIENAEAASGDSFDIEGFKNDFESKMNDDFNTPQAIAVLFDYLKPLRNAINNQNAPDNLDKVKPLLRSLVDDVLGLWPEAESGGNKKLTEGLVNLLLEMRKNARQEKNFELADEIRDHLNELGVEVHDNPEGSTFTITS